MPELCKIGCPVPNQKPHPVWPMVVNIILAIAALYGIFVQNSQSMVAMEHRITALETKVDMLLRRPAQ